MPRGKTVKAKHIFKKILYCVLLLFLVLLAGAAAYKLYIHLVTPAAFMIKGNNYIDYQNHYECSGYASAYVLRSLGEDVTGLELHGNFTNKNPDGSLPPGYLWQNLNAAGYKSKLLVGSLADLKYLVSRGTPVVVLIRLNTFQPYLHYIPVVGYDEETIYVADSLRYMANAENEDYNRAIPVEEFKELWKTDTFVLNNIFLTIKTA